MEKSIGWLVLIINEGEFTLQTISSPGKGQFMFRKTLENIPQALSIYINQLVYDLKRRGCDITTLSLGEAFFSLPLFDFQQLDQQAIHHYSDTRGLPSLRKKIANFYESQYGAAVDPQNEILISAGSKLLLYLTMLALVNPGEEVVIHEPAWLSYQEQTKLVDGTVKFIPYQHPIREFSDYFSEKTKLLIINNPNNPAGKLYTESELVSIYRQCQQNGITLLVDEAYSDFVPPGQFCSMAQLVPHKKGVIVVNSLSKNMGMSGWRIGYVIGQPNYINVLLTLNQHTMTCAPTILQHYLVHYFDQILGTTLPQVSTLLEKRCAIANAIDQLGLKKLPGSSTFYFFVSIDPFPGTAFDFAIQLLVRHGIAVVPGSAYGKSTERFIRLSIGTESEERIDAALKAIKTVIHQTDKPKKEQTESLLREHQLPLFELNGMQKSCLQNV